MSYLVIARKYRPQRFEDVVGQEHVTQTLANAIKMGRIAHAYLFCGPRGTGKTTIARIFAKCLNCVDGPRVDFADDDPRCKEIADGNSLDVIEIDGASNNGVEQVRQLREAVKYAPAVSRFKIYIIDEVHMLTQGAFNALLKTLEEPPPHVKFMFATTDPEKIPPTVLSRCQRFDLRRIPVRLIVNHLEKIAKNEGIEIDKAALFAIARSCEGCMRDAEGMLDQLISFCGNKIQESDVLAMFGITSATRVSELAQAIIDAAPDRTLKILNELSNSGKELTRLVSDLLSHFRNILVYKVSKGDTSLIDVTEEELKILSQQASTLTPEVLTRIMDTISECENELRDAVSRKALVEVTLVKAIQERSAISADVLLKHLQRLREEAAASGEITQTTIGQKEIGNILLQESSSSKTADAPAKVQTKAEPEKLAIEETSPVASNTTAGGAKQPSSLEELWSEVLKLAKKNSPFLLNCLKHCEPLSLEDKELTIAVGEEIDIALLDVDKNRKMICGILADLGQQDCDIKFIKKSGSAVVEEKKAEVEKKIPQSKQVIAPPALEEAVEEKPLSAENFKDDPLIKDALERFRGKIVNIKKNS
ncbi:MAG: DNA polymerase III subunit gamma/tau [Verrucomicrobiia bacterium]